MQYYQCVIMCINYSNAALARAAFHRRCFAKQNQVFSHLFLDALIFSIPFALKECHSSLDCEYSPVSRGF